MLPTLKNNAVAGYQGPGKIELLKHAGLLRLASRVLTKWFLNVEISNNWVQLRRNKQTMTGNANVNQRISSQWRNWTAVC